MIAGRTTTGFEFTVADESLDDMEVLEWLVELDNGSMTHLKDMMIRLLGEEQKKALYEHCRTTNGRVSAKAVFAEVGDIFRAAGNTGKN